MTYPKRNLIIVPECNDEHNNPLCWAMKAGETDIKTHYIWITNYDGDYIVEDSNGYNLTGNKVFKTLAGAKRQAEAIAWRQDESGFFTD